MITSILPFTVISCLGQFAPFPGNRIQSLPMSSRANGIATGRSADLINAECVTQSEMKPEAFILPAPWSAVSPNEVLNMESEFPLATLFETSVCRDDHVKMS